MVPNRSQTYLLYKLLVFFLELNKLFHLIQLICGAFIFNYKLQKIYIVSCTFVLLCKLPNPLKY